MKTLVAYLTGGLALLIVALSIVAAIIYAATHGTDTLSNLATSTLSGIGMAVGGCLGSALILRFKSARRFIGHTLNEINTSSYDALIQRQLAKFKQNVTDAKSTQRQA